MLTRISTFERILLWSIHIGLFLLLATPLVLFQNLFFPYITGKNFYFRVLVEIVFGAWVTLALFVPKYRLRGSTVFYALISFVGVLTLSSLFGVDPYHSFWSNFERMEGLVTHLHLLAFFTVLASTLKTKKEWFYFFNTSVAVSAVVAAWGFLQSVGILKILGEARPYASLGNSIYLAVYVIFHFFIIAALAYLVRNTTARVAYGGVFLLELYVFTTAVSRGATIGLAAGFMFVSFGLLFARKNRSLQIGAIALLLLFGFIGSLIVFAPQSAFIQRYELLSRFSSVVTKGLSQDPRIMIWGMAWSAFLERPILGWGPENFIVPYAKYYNPDLFGNEPWFDRVHNMLLEWLVAAGLVGFLAYLSIFAAVTYSLVVLVKKKHLDIVVALLIGGLFVAYIVQNIFVFDNIVTYIMVIVMLSYTHSLNVGSRPAHASWKISEPAAAVGSAVMCIALLLFVYFINIKPSIASAKLISALQALGERKTIEEVIAGFDSALSYHTFGDNEVRERLAESAVQIVMQAQNKPSKESLLLLKKSIDELTLEVRYQEFSAKPPLFLGKAYSLYSLWTGEGIDEAEQNYRLALARGPKYVQTHVALAELYLLRGQYREAIQEIDRGAALALRSSSMLYVALSTHVLANDAEGAEKILNNYINTIQLSNKVGFETEKIEAIFKRSMRVKDLRARTQFLERLYEYTGETATIHLIFAQTYGDLGDKAKARTHALRAGELDPSQSKEIEKFLKSIDVLLK